MKYINKERRPGESYVAYVRRLTRETQQAYKIIPTLPRYEALALGAEVREVRRRIPELWQLARVEQVTGRLAQDY